VLFSCPEMHSRERVDSYTGTMFCYKSHMLRYCILQFFHIMEPSAGVSGNIIWQTDSQEFHNGVFGVYWCVPNKRLRSIQDRVNAMADSGASSP
jgi:hypothetical protein